MHHKYSSSLDANGDLQLHYHLRSYGETVCNLGGTADYIQDSFKSQCGKCKYEANSSVLMGRFQETHV